MHKLKFYNNYALPTSSLDGGITAFSMTTFYLFNKNVHYICSDIVYLLSFIIIDFVFMFKIMLSK